MGLVRTPLCRHCGIRTADRPHPRGTVWLSAGTALVGVGRGFGGRRSGSCYSFRLRQAGRKIFGGNCPQGNQWIFRCHRSTRHFICRHDCGSGAWFGCGERAGGERVGNIHDRDDHSVGSHHGRLDVQTPSGEGYSGSHGLWCHRADCRCRIRQVDTGLRAGPVFHVLKTWADYSFGYIRSRHVDSACVAAAGAP